MHHLHTAYIITDNPPNQSYFVLGCVTLGLIFCIYKAISFRRRRKALTSFNTANKVNPYLIALLPVTIIFLCILPSDMYELTAYQYKTTLLISNSSNLKVAEGEVNNYYSNSKDGHTKEKFTVQGIEFHDAQFGKGRDSEPIRANQYVRVTYYYDGYRNAILKLETE